MMDLLGGRPDTVVGVAVPGPVGRRVTAAISDALERQERSRAWLARQVGVSSDTMGRWLRDEVGMEADEIAACVSALGLVVTLPDGTVTPRRP